MSTVLFRESVSGTLERSGNRWRAVLAVPGQGSSGFYSEEVLKEYGPSALAPGAKAFVGHDDERSPKDMIGVYPDGATYEDGVGLVGDLEVFPHWKEFIEAVGPHAGLSIYMMGESDSDGNVTKLIPDAMNGVDLVSYPGLEGSGLVEKLYEAAKRKIAEAAPDALKTGDFVSWSSSGGTARGKIERIVRDGSINVPGSDFTINGEPDNPAALIRLYRDGERTDTVVGHRFSTLTKIESLGEYGTKRDCGPGKKKVDGKCVDENMREDLQGFAEKDLVRMDHGDGETAYGQIAYIMTDGVFPFEGDPLAIPASEESPVALIRVWDYEGEDWVPTPMLMGHTLSELTKVSALGESKRSKKGTVAKQPQLTKMEGNHNMEKEEMKAMLSEFGTELVSAIAETLNPAEEIVEDEVDMAAVAEAAVKAEIPEALRQEIYEAAKGKTSEEAMALVEARKEMVNAIRKSIVDSVPTVSLTEGRVVESGSNVFSLTEITKVAK